MKNDKSEGKQAFNVPATDEGRAFIALLRKFANRPDCSIKVRGRGKRCHVGKKYHDALPLGLATWFAVYLTSEKAKKEGNGWLDNAYKQLNEVNAKLVEREKQICLLEAEVYSLKTGTAEKEMRLRTLEDHRIELRQRLADAEAVNLKQTEALRHTFKPCPRPYEPLAEDSTVTISIKGANIKIVQE